MNLKPILNKISPWTHTESEFDVPGVPGKLMKYVVHLSKKNLNFVYFSSYKLPKLQSSSFWFQGILGVKRVDNYNKNRSSYSKSLIVPKLYHNNRLVLTLKIPCSFLTKLYSF
jgi:hypothetical protein